MTTGANGERMQPETTKRRRDLRERSRRSPRPKRDLPRTVARATLLLALVTTTIAYGATTRAVPAEAAGYGAGPTAFSVLAAPAPLDNTTAVLRADPSMALVDREGLALTSRAVEREAVPGCSGIVTDIGTNGRLPASALCDLWQAPYQDRADAVVSLFALDAAFRAAFGRDLCLTSGYRNLEEQTALRAKKGGMAAPAGLSNHGWGLAVDICASDYAGEHRAWLDKNAPLFGWANPAWAQRNGGGHYEPWHWEFTKAVEEIDARG